MHAIKLARSFDLAKGKAPKGKAPEGETTVLVDALWPRGIKKQNLPLDDWCKAVAPTKGLRQWFGHDPAKWAEFQRRYTAELDGNEAAWRPLLGAAQRGPLTLVYSAKDVQHNNAVALRGYLQHKLEAAGTGGSGGAAVVRGKGSKKRGGAAAAAGKVQEGGMQHAKRARRAEE